MVAVSEVVVDVDTLAASSATVFDASWLYPPMNTAGVDVRARYAAAHLPGSIFLDLAALSPPRPEAPDVPAIAPPTPATVHAVLARLGLGLDAPLVVTDQEGGVATAPFARLALLDAGCTDVRLLDGGTPAWAAAGRPLTAERPRVAATRAPGEAPSADRLVGTRATRAAVADPAAVVVDARVVPGNAGLLPARYADVAIPADAVLRPGEVIAERAEGARFHDRGTLRALAAHRGLLDARAVLVTCHFGVGAAVVATALEIAGRSDVGVDAASILGWAQPAKG